MADKAVIQEFIQARDAYVNELKKERRRLKRDLRAVERKIADATKPVGPTSTGRTAQLTGMEAGRWYSPAQVRKATGGSQSDVGNWASTGRLRTRPVPEHRRTSPFQRYEYALPEAVE